MRITIGGGQRQAPYDRNPAQANLEFVGSAVAPHADVERDTYTCPNNKKAQIDIVQLQVERVTAAAPVGKFGVYVLVSGDELAKCFSRNNTAGGGRTVDVGSSIVIGAGTVVSIRSFDGSTGGTVDYDAQVNITEFDA